MRDGQAVRAIGYLRVSTDEQAASGAGLDAQRRAVEAEAARRGWMINLVVDGGYSAATLQRPGLAKVLEELDGRRASVLVVSKLDRLSRSVSDFSLLLDQARQRGWSVVCLDLGVDTTTATGELLANIVCSTAQYERRLIGQRTKDALAARRAAGVKLGRPRLLDPAVAAGSGRRVQPARRWRRSRMS